MVVCIIMYRVGLLLLGRILKFMTKFQFHVLISLALVIITFHLTGLMWHIIWCLVYIFTVFAIFDCIKVAQEENLKNKRY